MLYGRCWIWTGADNGRGYGKAKVSGRSVYVHRAAYEALVGPIPAGLDLDHLCRNRGCYNPAHLEPVTRAENLRRGANGVLLIACPAGHAYDGANTYLDPNGGKRCRRCHRERMRLAAH